MPAAVIVDAVRTPLAKGNQAAHMPISVRSIHAQVRAALVERKGIDPAVVDDVISGAVGQIGEQSDNIARLLNNLEQTGGRYGLQGMCEAGGLANATIIDRLAP